MLAGTESSRTSTARMEVAVVALGREDLVRVDLRQYLNRLSDLLFVAGRALNRHAGRGDVLWHHEKKRK